MLSEKEQNILELARADLWYLITHNEKILIEDIWRCGQIAESIGNLLDDKVSFEKTLQYWITHSARYGDLIKFLNDSRRVKV